MAKRGLDVLNLQITLTSESQYFTCHRLWHYIIFLGLTLYFGFLFAKKQKTTQIYFLAKGKVPSWTIGMSLLATLISSVTFLGYPGEGYSSNWILLVQGLMVPIYLMFTIWFIVTIFRKVIGLSTYEYFEERFGSFARYYSSSSFVLRQFSSMGTVLFLMAVALSNLTGGIIIMVNLKGGIKAVIWFDVFQGFMLLLSGFVYLGLLIYGIKGGLPAAWKVASENNHSGFRPYDLDFSKLTFIVMVINGAFYTIQKYATNQTVVQRYLTAKTDKSAIRASLIGIFLTVPVWMMFIFIGTLFDCPLSAKSIARKCSYQCCFSIFYDDPIANGHYWLYPFTPYFSSNL